MAVQTPSHARCTKESCLLEELQKTISGGCLFVAPVAVISPEKNLSVGVSTGGERKPGKENHERLLSR